MKDYNHPDRISSWLAKTVASAGARLSLETKRQVLHEGKSLIAQGFLRGDISQWLAKRSFLDQTQSNGYSFLRVDGKEMFEGLYL